MSQAHCRNFPACMNVGENHRAPVCEKEECPGAPRLFAHFLPRADLCEHDFGGWRDHKNEAGQIIGGEQVCRKCGMGAMAHTLQTGF